jgi:hypothetical protein
MNEEKIERILKKYEPLFDFLNTIIPTIGLLVLVIYNYQVYKHGKFESELADNILLIFLIFMIILLLYLNFVFPRQFPRLTKKYVSLVKSSPEGQEGIKNAIKIINFLLVIIGGGFIILVILNIFFRDIIGSKNDRLIIESGFGTIMLLLARRFLKKLLEE